MKKFFTKYSPVAVEQHFRIDQHAEQELADLAGIVVGVYLEHVVDSLAEVVDTVADKREVVPKTCEKIRKKLCYFVNVQ